jgi:hypothetical protein
VGQVIFLLYRGFSPSFTFIIVLKLKVKDFTSVQWFFFVKPLPFFLFQS